VHDAVRAGSAGAGNRGLLGRRRVVLGLLAAAGAVVIVVVALALARTQRDARTTVEERFGDGSKAAAALVQTIVAQAYTSNAAIAQARLSAPHPADADVRRAQSRLNAPILLVLDAGGTVILRRPATADIPLDSAPVREALAGRPAISGVIRSRSGRRLFELAVPFAARDGQRRVVLMANDIGAVQKALAPYLAGLPGLRGHRAYIMGPRHLRLADGDARRPQDTALRERLASVARTANVSYDEGRRQLASTAIAGTPWDLVDTVDGDVLYEPVDGWQRSLPWLVLLLLVPGGALLIWMADRAGRAAERSRIASEAKSAFMASMSHELRTPMTTVIGFSELLHDGKIGALSEQQHEVVGHIVTSSRHLNQLLGEILDLSRVEEGRLTFNVEKVDPERLAGEVVDGMRAMADDRSITLECHAGELGEAWLDPARFKQVLYNLISNAIKFTETGGTVSVSLSRAGSGALQIDVADEGPGIHPDETERIFLPFEQGQHRNGGAGLGLAITRRIVDAQGGSIVVHSTPASGATFRVLLPAEGER
jgi:signal transduction histidine kinase